MAIMKKPSTREEVKESLTKIIVVNSSFTTLLQGITGMSLVLLYGLMGMATYVAILKMGTKLASLYRAKLIHKYSALTLSERLSKTYVSDMLLMCTQFTGNVLLVMGYYKISLVFLFVANLLGGVLKGFSQLYYWKVIDELSNDQTDREKFMSTIDYWASLFDTIGISINMLVFYMIDKMGIDAELSYRALIIMYAISIPVDICISIYERKFVKRYLLKDES